MRMDQAGSAAGLGVPGKAAALGAADALTRLFPPGESIRGVEPSEAASSGGAHVTVTGSFSSTATHSCRFADVRNALNSMTGS